MCLPKPIGAVFLSRRGAREREFKNASVGPGITKSLSSGNGCCEKRVISSESVGSDGEETLYR